MSRKRTKKANNADAPCDPNITPKVDLLMLLPVEIIAQILIYTRSTRDVLAVARCSRHLCAILVDPSNASIWSAARKDSAWRTMPDPPSSMPEPAYAAFVFDGGKCEVSFTFFRLSVAYIHVLPPKGLSKVHERDVLLICRQVTDMQ